MNYDNWFLKMEKLNILLIGSGGREHALAISLKKSKSCGKLFATPGNPGIAEVAEIVENLIGNEDISQFCIENDINLVVVGPEQPLAEGICDHLNLSDIVVFGPSKHASQLESSKEFAKHFMVKNNIPTANFKSFPKSKFEEAKNYVINHSLPLVLKADGLAAGKGVVIAHDHKTAIKELEEIFSGKFGSAGSSILIEEFMQGEEASIFAICDGEDYLLLPPSQDHKRIGEGDTGLNTGGMGAYAPAPIVNEEVLEKVKEKILEPTLSGMARIGHPFKGCLYCGLMIENNNPKVVEFNVRFGDPETQVVLPLVEGDIAQLFYSAATGKLNKDAVNILSDKHAATVVLASGGYPESYQKGKHVSGIEDTDEVIIYHAGTKKESNNLVTSGGRVLAVTAVGENLENAINKAYSNVNKIKFDNMYYRKDIGSKALK